MSGESRTTAQLTELIREGMVPSVGTTMNGEEMIELIAALLKEAAHPDFVTVMVDQSGNASEYPGIAGFREGLGDWISPYEEFRLRIDKMVPASESAVVFLVTQGGVTKHGGVEVESPGATVWWLEDGAIRQAFFYIDQRAALKAAGIASPDHLPGD
jgi:ketosteroid isomerase-like protein